jgi:hypothetical protein
VIQPANVKLLTEQFVIQERSTGFVTLTSDEAVATQGAA